MAFAVDTTAYTAGMMPELALRQAMHKECIPAEVRIGLANSRITTMARLAVLGEDITQLEVKLATILKDKLGQDEADRLINTALLSVVWKTAKALMEFEAAQAGRLPEDPHKIPRCRPMSSQP